MSPTIPPNQSKLLTSAGHCAAETRVPWRRTGSFRGAQTSDPSSRSTITSSAWTLTQECCFQLQPSNSTKICKKISKAAWMSHLGKWHTYRIHKNNFPSFKRQTKKISINLLLRSFLLRFSFTYKMKTKQWFRVCAHACGGLGKTCGGSALSFHETGSGTRIQAWGQGSWTHFTVINLLILCICASMSTYMEDNLWKHFSPSTVWINSGQQAWQQVGFICWATSLVPTQTGSRVSYTHVSSHPALGSPGDPTQLCAW